MDTLDSDTLSLITGNLGCDDLKNTVSVNRDLKIASAHALPNMQLFFKAKADNQKDTCCYDPSVIFPYNRPLSVPEVEYWAKVGHILKTRCRNRGLYNVIHHALSRFNHSRHSQNEHPGTLTGEQSAIVDCEPAGNNVIIVQAFAGTGKTTTLFRYARRWDTRCILYLAYNKALADESSVKFENIQGVNVMTIHALAYKHFISLFPDHDVGNLSAADVRAHIFTEDPDYKRSKHLIDRFNIYVNSDKREITENDVQRVWDCMFCTRQIKVSHDAYLKYYQLQNPKLEYDIIMLDEVQDCTDCILDILMSQHCTRIVVGDRYQQIYSFKNVNDPFTYIRDRSHFNGHDTNRFKLSKSFRMGFDLMYHANIVLNKKFNEKRAFSSCKPVNTVIDNTFANSKLERYPDLPKGTVILFRYNYSIYDTIFNITDGGISFRCLGKSINFDKEIKITNELIALQEGKDVTHPKLVQFSDFDEMTTFYQILNNNRWNDRLRLYATHGARLIGFWERAKNHVSDDPDLILTTAHQSKGMEFDNVLLFNDFQLHNEESVRLLYVAMTRARQTLYTNNVLYQFFERHQGKIYYKDCMSSKQSNRCSVCRTRFTNNMCITDADNEKMLSSRGDLFAYEYVCNTCQGSLF